MRSSRFPSCARPRTLAAVLLLALGCSEAPSAPASAVMQLAELATKGPAPAVPFKGDATGQDISVTFEAAGVHIVAAVTGTGTGVGKFTEVLDYVLAYDFVNFAGTGTITAADGSQLFLRFTGAIPGFAEQVFPLPYSAAYTITGGTSRFARSGGWGTISGTDFGGGRFQFSFTGTRTPEVGAQ